MRNKRSIGNGRAGKSVVILAVLIMTAMAMTVLTGCQNSVGNSVIGSEQDGDEQPDSAGTSQHGNGGTGAVQAKNHKASRSDKDKNTTADGDKSTQPDNDGLQAGSESTGTKEPPAGFELTLDSENWGLSFGEAGTQPRGNALPEDLAWYDAYYVGDDNEKVIYLTFDCGYENGNTEPILDALKKHDVKATFFVVGHFLETAPELAKRMVEEGHTVGNHTYHHLDMPTISDRETFQKEVDDVADLFREITGTELSLYYRPPQGKCNADNLKMAYELGYKTIFWSLAYVDWDQDNQPSHKEAFDKLTTRVHPGAIVLLHNTSSTNGEILDELLTKWEEMGYVFRTLSYLTQEQGLLQ